MTAFEKAILLGREGEDSAAQMLVAWEVGSGFQAAVVMADDPKIRDEIRRRFHHVAGDLTRIDPNPKTLDSQLRNAAGRVTSRTKRAVLWLEQPRGDSADWRRVLSMLNQDRSWLISDLPVFLVVAGPFELQEHGITSAPDLWSICGPIRRFKEEPKDVPRGGPVRWLHISDMHFREDESWDRQDTLQAFLRKLDELKDAGLKPDLVFVTGDIAFSGRRLEYEQAERFFAEVNKKLELDPKLHWFLVPGNHDVDRTKIEFFHDAILKSLVEGDDIKRFFKSPNGLKVLGGRLAEFYSFTDRFLGRARGWTEDLPFRFDVREANGISVGVLQLNSAWASGSDKDRGSLVIGKIQVQQSLAALRDANVRFALVHHPLEDLKEFDAEDVEGRLSAPDGAHFLLRGHRHKTKTALKANPDGILARMAAGALYADGPESRGFNVGELDIANGVLRVRLFRYSSEGRGFWVAENGVYEKAPEGVWELPLPASLQASVEPIEERGARAAEAAQDGGLTARYRRAAGAYFGRARFIGFADHRPRPNAALQELFVPLRLTVQGSDAAAAGDGLTTAQLSKKLLEDGRRASLSPLETGRRDAPTIVVLGDPGSGKSTLCRFLAVVVAGEISLPGAEAADEPLPLLIPFREYVHYWSTEPHISLVDFLEWQATAELSVPLPAGFLQRKLADGGAVLLLDGLDEVGSPENRVRMRDRVRAFTRAFPRVPMLITSRVAGYHEAPLSSDRDRALLTLRLAPFNEADLREFVERWYAIQEPNDPAARDKGTADLLAALSAEPRIAKLAESPLLATLIALVHRFEAHLPGERAKLYDLCIKTFLETWPAAAKKEFRGIDAGLQRAYLEELAYEMQMRRKANDKTVTISRADLVEALVNISSARGVMDGADEQRRLVERWVVFLEEGAGLLLEQSPGVFAFFHLSFMEFLAAKGWERRAGPQLATEIAGRVSDWKWLEVCLLAVGVHAEDGPFLDKLFDEHKVLGTPGRWIFLLRCLLEEAVFDVNQRDEILRNIAERALERDLLGLPEIIARIVRFSIRNARVTEKWLEDHLTHANEAGLLPVTALCLEREPQWLVGVLERRSDRLVAARWLIALWPGSGAGDWAACRVDAESARLWATTDAAIDTLRLQCLAGLRQACAAPLLCGLSLAIAKQVIRHALQASSGLCELANQPRPGGRGVPGKIRIRPGLQVVHTAPRLPVRAHMPALLGAPAPRRALRLSLKLARSAARDIAHTIGGSLTTHVGQVFAEHFTLAFALTFRDAPASGAKPCFEALFNAECARAFALDFSDAFDDAVANDFGIGFMKAVDLADRESWAATFGVEPLLGSAALASPVDRARAADNELPIAAALQGVTSRKRVGELAHALLAAMVGEAWAAAAAALRLSLADAYGVLLLRLQNRWLYQLWPHVDTLMPAEPTTSALALYFALAWTQFTTTWTWPQTERWLELFGTQPPEHWYPRAQWHLCWLTYDPELKEHQEGLDRALRDGDSDSELPGYSTSMREALGLAEGD